MAPKTLIRNKTPHEVVLPKKSKVAQSPQAAHPDTPAEVPPLIRKTTGKRRVQETETSTAAPAVAKAPARKKASPAPTEPAPLPPARKRASPKSRARTAPEKPQAQQPPAEAKPSPRLPAFVPADKLWEPNSAVAQRLKALLDRNAQLTEQLQRLQNSPLSKG